MANQVFTSREGIPPAVVEATLEKYHGNVIDHPKAGKVLLSGCYGLFLDNVSGEVDEKELADCLRQLISGGGDSKISELVAPPGTKWPSIFQQAFPNGSTRIQTHMDPASLQEKALSLLVEESNKAISSFGFETRWIRDKETVSQVAKVFEPMRFLLAFRDVDDFLKRGFGCFAIEKESQEVASLCLSWMVSSSRIEISIATRPQFQRKGLAKAVSSEVVREALRRNLIPEWTAGNPKSVGLATYLGYSIKPVGIETWDFH